MYVSGNAGYTKGTGCQSLLYNTIIQQIMIKSNSTPYYAQWQRVVKETPVFFDNSNTYNQHQRIHGNSLIPAKNTWREA
jgi:hypothetical protein